MVETLPASWYHDPAIYEAERRAVFGREWLLVGRTAQLAHRGAYIAPTIAGWNLLVLALDDAGTLRAFHNVCRHRAGPLVDTDEGTCGNGLVCRYHGWSYDLEGALVQARDFGADPGATSLVPVRVDTWRGLVFVNLDPDAVNLLDSLGGFVAECDGFPMEGLTFTAELRDEVAANWKAYADNYLEGYHIPLVHRELNRQIDSKRYTVDVGERYCRHTAPARDGSPTTGTWLWRYPNLAVNLYPDGMNIERFIPVGVGRTAVVYQYFLRDGGDLEGSMKLSAALLDEDRAIVEAVQRNLESGAYSTGLLSPRHEDGVAHFQSLVRRAVEG